MGRFVDFGNGAARVDSEAAALRTEKLAAYGSIEGYLARLRPRLIEAVGTPDFHDFYALYAAIFTLPEEREDEAGFARVLALTHDPRLRARFGPFAEKTLCVRDPDTGEMIGAVDFFVMARRAGEDLGGLDGMVQINYLFVDDRYRKMGLGSYLIGAAERAALDFIRDNGPLPLRARMRRPVMALFCEQNAPLKMTAAEYMQDNSHALIDQCDRLGWWQARGFRRLDFDYVQPPLEDGGAPCRSLTLNARMPDGMALTGRVLRRFLETYLSVSVLKGRDVGCDADFRAMRAALEARNVIPARDDRDMLPAMKAQIRDHLAALAAAGMLAADDRPLGRALAEGVPAEDAPAAVPPRAAWMMRGRGLPLLLAVARPLA